MEPTFQELTSVPYLYTQCDRCGKSITSENGTDLKIPKNSKVNQAAAIAFPHSWNGNFSEEGLRIFTPRGASNPGDYTILNTEGSFFVFFKEREFSVFKVDHPCPGRSINENSLEKSNLQSPIQVNRDHSFIQYDRVYLGLYIQKINRSFFTGSGSGSQTLTKSEDGVVSIVLNDGREVKVKALSKGVVIDGLLHPTLNGTFKIEILAGDNLSKNQYQLTDITE